MGLFEDYDCSKTKIKIWSGQENKMIQNLKFSEKKVCKLPYKIATKRRHSFSNYDKGKLFKASTKKCLAYHRYISSFRLKSILHKFCRHQNLVDRYDVDVSLLISDMFSQSQTFRYQNSCLMCNFTDCIPILIVIVEMV